MNKVPRIVVFPNGKVRERSDIEIVSEALEGYQFADGRIERLEERLSDFKQNLIKLLLELHGKDLVDLCEEKTKDVY